MIATCSKRQVQSNRLVVCGLLQRKIILRKHLFQLFLSDDQLLNLPQHVEYRALSAAVGSQKEGCLTQRDFEVRQAKEVVYVDSRDHGRSDLPDWLTVDFLDGCGG